MDKQELKLFLKQEFRNIAEEDSDYSKIALDKLFINLGKAILIDTIDKHYNLGLLEEINVKGLYDRDE